MMWLSEIALSGIALSEMTQSDAKNGVSGALVLA